MSGYVAILERGACLKGHTVARGVVPRILHFNSEYVWIGDVSFALPQTGVATRYATAPRAYNRADIEAKVRSKQVHQFELIEPEHWRRARDLQVAAHPRPPQAMTTQRNLQRWTEIYQRRLELVLPLLEDLKFDFGQILESGIYKVWPILRARELKIAPRTIYDSLHRTVIGGGTFALMPAYEYCGAPGQPRYLKAPEEPSQEGSGWTEGKYLTTKECREVLREGYRKYVRPGISLEVAYERTLAEYWSTSIEYLPDAPA